MNRRTMDADRDSIEASLRLHVDRLAGLIGPRTLSKPKTIEAAIGYIEGQWSDMGLAIDRECYDAMGDCSVNTGSVCFHLPKRVEQFPYCCEVPSLRSGLPIA
ncbi:MAG: hypothetical protein AAF670_07160 [Planctomycetota bacterium]